MTYDEILTASADTTLKNRVKVAIIIAADKIRTEDPRATPLSEARRRWAKLALTEPDAQVPSVLWAVLAQNKTLTPAQVTGATDTAIQTAVDAAVTAFAL